MPATQHQQYDPTAAIEARLTAQAQAAGTYLRDALVHVYERDLLPNVTREGCDICLAKQPTLRGGLHMARDEDDTWDTGVPDNSVDMRDDLDAHDVQCSYAIAGRALKQAGY